MKYLVTKPNGILRGTIDLPASKSISNRVLIIKALCNNSFTVNNLSDSDDTLILKKALSLNDHKIDIGHAGTAMRFLTAYLAGIEGEWELTGSSRMKQRPIGILVNALNQLGADIKYLEKQGFPPLLISGTRLVGKSQELDGTVSSQYISALLMIAPVISNGLILKLNGEITSKSYIEMTLNLMSVFGIKYNWSGDTITIPEQDYLPVQFTVESDWSSASYWYEALALADNGEIFLKSLSINSLQGDSKIYKWFKLFGIESIQQDNGILLIKPGDQNPEKLILDFIENPDMAQTMACLCVAKRIPFHFSGLKTLKIKETDRVSALIYELAKFGAALSEPAPGELEWNGRQINITGKRPPVIKTYNDHRMALSFAPMTTVGFEMEIEDPGVVSKSYPGFWNDLKKAGYEINSSNK